MQLENIELAKLSVSPVNMRNAKKPPDISDILPSVRVRGVLVPLLVRPNGSADTYEIVAGRRRYHAAMTVAQEGGYNGPLRCAVLGDGDDAAALEASLIENLVRENPDEVTQWEQFNTAESAWLDPEAYPHSPVILTPPSPRSELRSLICGGVKIPQTRAPGFLPKISCCRRAIADQRCRRCGAIGFAGTRGRAP